MKRSTRRGLLCFWLALFLTTWSVGANLTCTVPEIAMAMVVAAVSFSVSALALLGIAWQRVSVPRRVVSVVLALAALWVIADAGGRRLTAMLGR